MIGRQYHLEGKCIYIAVTNDLVIDQRVHRTALTLLETGAKPVLVGFKRPGSQTLPERSYATLRLSPVFQKGFLFYACVNLRLFFFLLFRNSGMLVSNDLDTLPGVFLVARIKRIPLVFDSHEYFTELPELVDRSFVRRVWKGFEKTLLPRIQYGYTVCQSISHAYQDKYGIRLAVVRNLPIASGLDPGINSHTESNRPETIIYQGALNKGRGLETMIRAMTYLDKYRLQIFGDGTITQDLHRLRDSLSLGSRVEFMGRVPFGELSEYTRQATLGISLEENIGLNYYYTLPNKLFDYIQAQIPVLVSDLPEMKRIVSDYAIGQVVRNRDPEILARQVEEMMSSEELRKRWKKNLHVAAAELCWENEVDKLRDVYRDAGLVFPVIPPSPE
jgi:glycosyltransferase involved in cell wall biosynthesis